MLSKVLIAVLATLAIAHGATLSHKENNVQNIVPVEREGRHLLTPLVGTILLKSLKVGWFLISSICSLVGYKLAALAIAAKVVFWLFGSSPSVILGALAMLGFCKLTGKCSLDYIPHQLVQVGDSLVYAARSLENGEAKYGGNDEN